MRHVVAMSGFLITAGAHAQIGFGTYQQIDIPLLPGTTQSAALAVNNGGDTVGWCRDDTGAYYGFLFRFQSGELLNLGAMGSSQDQELGPRDINDAGEVVGVFMTAGGSRAFHWASGVFRDISSQPGSATLNAGAYGINAQGNIAGFNTIRCGDGGYADVGVVWASANAAPTPVMPSLGACGFGGIALGISDSGEPFGWADLSSSGAHTPYAFGHAMMSFSSEGNSEIRGVTSTPGVWLACGVAENPTPFGDPTGPCYWYDYGQIFRLMTNPYPGAGEANAINSHLLVVGWSNLRSGRAAMLWRADSPLTMNLNGVVGFARPGVLTTASDVSETNFVVGRAEEGTPNQRAFLVATCSVSPVVSHPENTQTCPHGVAEFTVVGHGATARFIWEMNYGTVADPQWTDLDDGPASRILPASVATISGSNTNRLILTNVTAVDARQYRCIVSTCNAVRTNPASLSICAPDTNCDGFLDFFDYDDFVIAFEAGNLASDFNGDGFLDFFDYDDFVVAYETGC